MSYKEELSREVLLRNQAQRAYIGLPQMGRLITETANSILGDELLLRTPFRSLAAEYLGHMATFRDDTEQSANAAQDLLPPQGASVSLGSMMYGTGHQLIGKYQHPDIFASDYPDNLPWEHAEDLARETVRRVDEHLAAAYNNRYGNL